jgi:hypothetical protein
MPTQADRTGATLLQKAEWQGLAALPTVGVNSAGLAGALPGKSPQLLIEICCCQGLIE